MTEIRHPLAIADGKVMEAIRTASAPGKGHIDRAPFDEVLEQTPDAAGVTYETGVVGGVPGVWCRPADAQKGAVILYFHGGAYVAGTAQAFRHLAGHIASRGGAVAFVPDYRLAPEHRYPAPVEDAKAVYRGLSEQGASAIAIVGDSAGGGLALVLLSIAQAEALAERGLAPCAGAAMSPWADLALAGSSLKDRADADPFLTLDALTRAADQYLDGQDPQAPGASPLYGNLHGLPPVQLHTGTDEILFDDARRYAERAREASVDVTVHVWEGMPHVFQSNVGKLAAADQSLDLIGNFFRRRLGGK
jgi:epsilon-lactone hydrolase